MIVSGSNPLFRIRIVKLHWAFPPVFLSFLCPSFKMLSFLNHYLAPRKPSAFSVSPLVKYKNCFMLLLSLWYLNQGLVNKISLLARWNLFPLFAIIGHFSLFITISFFPSHATDSLYSSWFFFFSPMTLPSLIASYHKPNIYSLLFPQVMADFLRLTSSLFFFLALNVLKFPLPPSSIIKVIFFLWHICIFFRHINHLYKWISLVLPLIMIARLHSTFHFLFLVSLSPDFLVPPHSAMYIILHLFFFWLLVLWCFLKPSRWAAGSPPPFFLLFNLKHYANSNEVSAWTFFLLFYSRLVNFYPSLGSYPVIYGRTPLVSPFS